MVSEAEILTGWPMAQRVARSEAWRRGGDPDEALSAAALGLCLAARDYRDGLGVPFEAYSVTRIRGAVADDVRAARPCGFKRRVVAGAIYPTFPAWVVLEDVQAPPPAMPWVATHDVHRLIDRAALTVRQRQVLRLLAYGWSSLTIARHLGVTEIRVSQVKRRAIAIIQQELKEGRHGWLPDRVCGGAAPARLRFRFRARADGDRHTESCHQGASGDLQHGGAGRGAVSVGAHL